MGHGIFFLPPTIPCFGARVDLPHRHAFGFKRLTRLLTLYTAKSTGDTFGKPERWEILLQMFQDK